MNSVYLYPSFLVFIQLNGYCAARVLVKLLATGRQLRNGLKFFVGEFIVSLMSVIKTRLVVASPARSMIRFEILNLWIVFRRPAS